MPCCGMSRRLMVCTSASMMFERGEISRVKLDPTIGSEQQGHARPCVVLTLTSFNQQLRTVGVVPLTSSPRALAPLIVPVPSAGKANAMALCHQICTIDKTRVGKRLGSLAPHDLAAVEDGVRKVHGL
jgi:mRNA interferase ChpB